MSDAPGSGEFGREWTHGVERRTARQNRPSRTWGWERDPISASRISQHEFKISARSTDRPAGMAECAEMWAECGLSVGGNLAERPQIPSRIAKRRRPENGHKGGAARENRGLVPPALFRFVGQDSGY